MQRIEKIGQQISEARERKGMSLSELAEAVGINSWIYMEDIEKGLRIPKNEEVCRKIAEVLGIELVSYEEYWAASLEDSKEMFEINKSAKIAKVNSDFGTNLPEDATKEMVDQAMFGKIFGLN